MNIIAKLNLGKIFPNGTIKKIKPQQQFQILKHKKEIYKLVLLLCVVQTILSAGIMIHQQSSFKELLIEKENNIFVVKDHKVYAAEVDKSVARSKYELSNFVRTWITNGFSYNKLNYNERFSLALEWMDESSATILTNGMENSNVRNMLYNTNAYTGVEIDSININLDKAQLYFHWETYLEDQLNNAKPYKLTATIKPIIRSEINPFGLLLTNIKYFEN